MFFTVPVCGLENAREQTFSLYVLTLFRYTVISLLSGTHFICEKSNQAPLDGT